MLAPGKDRTLEGGGRIVGDLTRSVDSHVRVQLAPGPFAQQQLAPGCRTRSKIDDKRLALARESESDRVSPEDRVNPAVRRHTRGRIRSMERNQVLARRSF